MPPNLRYGRPTVFSVYFGDRYVLCIEVSMECRTHSFIHSSVRFFNENTVITQWFNNMQCIKHVVTNKCTWISQCHSGCYWSLCVSVFCIRYLRSIFLSKCPTQHGPVAATYTAPRGLQLWRSVVASDKFSHLLLPPPCDILLKVRRI